VLLETDGSSLDDFDICLFLYLTLNWVAFLTTEPSSFEKLLVNRTSTALIPPHKEFGSTLSHAL
jgi:hypothetical protein